MATYYVDGTNGSDTNAGTSAAAAWATIDKALTGGMASVTVANTVYVAPGTYRKHSVVSITPSALQTFIADVDLAHFAGVTGLTGGAVVWTAYETNDTTAPVAFATLDLGGKSNFTFQGFTFVGGGANPTCVNATTTNSQSITFQQCTFLSGSSAAGARLIAYAGAASAAATWTLDRCVLFGSLLSSSAFECSVPLNATADHDVGVTVMNCLALLWGTNSNTVLFTTSGTGTFKPGGGVVKHCTFLSGAGNAGVRTDPNWSTGTPARAFSNLIMAYAYCLSAGTPYSLVENYNRLLGPFPRYNVTAGANSISNDAHAALLEVGQWLQDGRAPRPVFAPMAGSPLLGRGADASYTSSTDYAGRPRPAGGRSTNKAWGYLERHDTAAKETTTVDAGGVGAVITGPGDHDFRVPVDATSTTITLRMRYDTSGDNGSGTRPQLTLLANGEIGVTTQTVQMTAANNTWETVTLSAFTPTARGWVTLRVDNSRSTSGTGRCYFDTFSVT